MPCHPPAPSTPNLSSFIQVLSIITPKQINQIFGLTRWKLEAELAATEDEARLRQELIVKESDARVVAATTSAVAATATATAAAKPQRRILMTEEDDITDEVPPKVMSITLCFAGLPQEEIVRIFHNKFKPINLYQLCHIQGL